MAGALHQGHGKSAEHQELKRRYKQLERSFTDKAIKKEVLENFLNRRPTLLGRSSKRSGRNLSGERWCVRCARPCA